MSERARYRFNLVAWVAVSLTLCTSSIRGLWYLAEMAHGFKQLNIEVRGLREDAKQDREEINHLKDRTTRIEEHIKISGEFIDHTRR